MTTVNNSNNSNKINKKITPSNSNIVFQVYAVKDVLAGTFASPMVFENELIAKRWFTMQSAKSEFAKDLELWHLGEFEIATGKLSSDVDFVMSGVMAIGGNN